MSGRVQKESADDSDRIDDAVDPRVQVSAAAAAAAVRVCVARTESRGVPPRHRAILTLSSSLSAAATGSCGKNRESCDALETTNFTASPRV